MSQVTFGTTLGGFGAGLVSGPTLCDWAEEIEQLGFDILFYRDHVLWHSPVLDPFTMLGAFAARTTTIKLGTGVLLLPLRNPTLVAKMIGTLDWLSNGRAILGVGVGGEFQKEYEACGISLRERGRRAIEGLQVIKALWTDSSATVIVGGCLPAISESSCALYLVISTNERGPRIDRLSCSLNKSLSRRSVDQLTERRCGRGPPSS